MPVLARIRGEQEGQTMTRLDVCTRCMAETLSPLMSSTFIKNMFTHRLNDGVCGKDFKHRLDDPTPPKVCNYPAEYVVTRC